MSCQLKPAVFLDRDGVINQVPSDLYVKSWEEFVFVPDIFPALSRLIEADFLLFVVSNQAGIGRGIISWEAFLNINKQMLKACKENGVNFSGIYFCPHIPDANCPCRKPNPTLLKSAASDFDLDLAASFVLGDMTRDLEAGERAGCSTIFVTTGQGTREDINGSNVRVDFIAGSLNEAVTWILDRKKV